MFLFQPPFLTCQMSERAHGVPGNGHQTLLVQPDLRGHAVPTRGTLEEGAPPPLQPVGKEGRWAWRRGGAGGGEVGRDVLSASISGVDAALQRDRLFLSRRCLPRHLVEKDPHANLCIASAAVARETQATPESESAKLLMVVTSANVAGRGGGDETEPSCAVVPATASSDVGAAAGLLVSTPGGRACGRVGWGLRLGQVPDRL
ncbi:unnamed protein product [Lampetra planeri]